MFKVLKKDKNTRARTGVLKLNRGAVKTPVFMPVGTLGTVKALPFEFLKKLQLDIILSNTYHLFLRPGIDVIKAAGSLHDFINWDKNILTDSGGFQIFSLNSLRKISERGVEFKSHINGAKFFMTPEKCVTLQKDFNSDIVMTFDECTPYGVSKGYVEKADKRTARWAERCRKIQLNKGQKMFGIIQGNVFKDLRKKSAYDIINTDFDGYAIGGLSVGEPRELMYDIAGFTADLIPENKPRYLMGVGTPEDLFLAVENGIDMMDCVFPTRVARNGTLFTRNGRINILNSKYEKDFKPIDEKCGCFVCRKYTRSYLRHLQKSKEILGLTLNSYHNIYFMMNLMKEIRESIEKQNFSSFKKSFFNALVN